MSLYETTKLCFRASLSASPHQTILHFYCWLQPNSVTPSPIVLLPLQKPLLTISPPFFPILLHWNPESRPNPFPWLNDHILSLKLLCRKYQHNWKLTKSAVIQRTQTSFQTTVRQARSAYLTPKSYSRLSAMFSMDHPALIWNLEKVGQRILQLILL